MTPLSLGFPDDLRGDSTAFEDMAVGLFNRSRKERQAWVDDASSGELRQWRLAVVNWIAGIEDGDPRELYESALRLGPVLSLLVLAGERGVLEGYFEAGLLVLSVSLTPFQRSLGFAYLIEAGRAGYGPAQAEVGRRFADGRGVRRSDLAAYTWLLIARGNGESVGSVLGEVESRLSPEARRDAVRASAHVNTAPVE